MRAVRRTAANQIIGPALDCGAARPPRRRWPTVLGVLLLVLGLAVFIWRC